jgi:hypothetical protein
MKLKFKHQDFQTLAVEAVVDCFNGQPNRSGITYRIDPGTRIQEEMFKSAILFQKSQENSIPLRGGCFCGVRRGMVEVMIL